MVLSRVVLERDCWCGLYDIEDAASLAGGGGFGRSREVLVWSLRVMVSGVYWEGRHLL